MADAVNFNKFEVEKSIDGRTYTKVAELPLTATDQYNWTDRAGVDHTTYYRLKMVDIDQEYKYSNTVSVENNCQVQNIKVYPTITDNQVQVTLPQGYDRAVIQVYNTNGQRMNPVITGKGSLRTVYLQGLPKASYVLQVTNGTERKSFIIIKP